VTQHSPEEAQANLVKAFAASQLSIEELWLRYFALGGEAGSYEIEAYLTGLMQVSAHQHNILAQAINERLAELPPPPRATYRNPNSSDS
jgi:hypothetical protein